MACRVELNNLSYVLGGGYVICAPINPDTMFYTLAITSGNTHHSNFTCIIRDDYTPNTQIATADFTAKNQTRNFIIPYTYGVHRRFFIQFGNSVDGEDYDYDLTCSKCQVNSLTTPTIDPPDNNFIILFRQNPTISFTQNE